MDSSRRRQVCEFSHKRGTSSDSMNVLIGPMSQSVPAGDGMAEEVYGDCKKGLVRAESLQKSVSSLETGGAMAAIARAIGVTR